MEALRVTAVDENFYLKKRYDRLFKKVMLSVQIDNEGSANMSSIYAAKFQLGHALIHSLDRSDIPSGIEILEQLVKKHHDSDARRDYSK